MTNLNIDKIYNNYLNDTKKSEDSLLEEKELLEKENILNNSTVEAYYGSDIKGLEDDIKGLEDEKDVLTKKINEIRQAYIGVDNMVALKRVALLDIFKNKLNEINIYYNNVSGKIKDANNMNDVFKDNVANVFKKNEK